MTSDSVFMIGWEYPPHNSGGLGVACQGLTQALAQDGQKVYLTLPYKLPKPLGHMDVLSCVDERWYADASVIGFGLRPPFSSYTAETPTHANHAWTPEMAASELSALPQSVLESKVKQYSEHVAKAALEHKDHFVGVHAHDWMSFPAAIEIKNRLKKKFIAHVHSTEFDRIPNGNGSHYIHHTEYEGMQEAEKIIAVSNYTKQLIVQKYDIDPGKIEVVYNGIDPLDPHRTVIRRAFAPKRPVIVFMGRLTMQKGADHFLRLAQKVVQTLPDALLVVAGHGDQYTSLLLQNAGMKLSANVLFTGFLRGTAKADLLNRADVFVMPSLSEPFGLVALEAAQRNTPVIVSKTSGVAEVMPSAVAMDFWDIDQMAREIGKLANQPEERQAQVAAQHQDLSQLTWQRASNDVRSIYKSLFTGARSKIGKTRA